MCLFISVPVSLCKWISICVCLCACVLGLKSVFVYSCVCVNVFFCMVSFCFMCVKCILRNMCIFCVLLMYHDCVPRFAHTHTRKKC